MGELLLFASLIFDMRNLLAVLLFAACMAGVSADCVDIDNCGECINKENAFSYECFWCPADGGCHAYGSPATKCTGTDCISKSKLSTCAFSKCPAPPPPPSTMRVVVQNQASFSMQVVKTNGTSEAALCTLKPGSKCTVTEDFNVITDGPGGGDSRSGDPFDQWWGGPGWATAHVTIGVTQDPANPKYLKYTKLGLVAQKLSSWIEPAN